MRIKGGGRRSFRIYGFTPEGCRTSRGNSRSDGHGVSIDTRTEGFKVNTEDFKRG
jgi:hypothetical protein